MGEAAEVCAVILDGERWLIIFAIQQWKEGMRIMKQAKRVRTAQGEGWQVMSGVS